jgi:hypothetical protein
MTLDSDSWDREIKIIQQQIEYIHYVLSFSLEQFCADDILMSNTSGALRDIRTATFKLTNHCARIYGHSPKTVGQIYNFLEQERILPRRISLQMAGFTWTTQRWNLFQRPEMNNQIIYENFPEFISLIEEFLQWITRKDFQKTPSGDFIVFPSPDFPSNIEDL